MAIFYTQLHTDRSRYVATAVEIPVRLYVWYGCPYTDFTKLSLENFKEFLYRLAWKSDRRCSRRLHDTNSHIGRRKDGRTWFPHKTFFFVYFVMDAYKALFALKEFCSVAHSCSCILPNLDHAEKCLNIPVTDLYRQWYFSLYSFKHHFVKTCIEGGRGDIGVANYTHYFFTGLTWVVSITLRLLCPRGKTPGTHNVCGCLQSHATHSFAIVHTHVLVLMSTLVDR